MEDYDEYEQRKYTDNILNYDIFAGCLLYSLYLLTIRT